MDGAHSTPLRLGRSCRSPAAPRPSIIVVAKPSARRRGVGQLHARAPRRIGEARAARSRAVQPVRAGRARAHLYRTLRAHGVHGRTPHVGNRHPHGARCHPIGRSLGSWSGRPSPTCWRVWRWASLLWIGGRLASRILSPLLHQVTSPDRRGDWRARLRHDGGRPPAGQTRRTDRSDDCASDGVSPGQ